MTISTKTFIDRLWKLPAETATPCFYGALHPTEPTLQLRIETHKINPVPLSTVIIEDCNRLARDLMVQEFILGDFRKYGTEVVSAHDGSLSADDPTRTLIRQVLGAVAQYDKEMTVLMLRAARDRKRARDGKCEGAKSYEELKPEVLREMKRLRRPRKGLGRRSYREIAEELNTQGFTTPRGRKFTADNVRMALKLH